MDDLVAEFVCEAAEGLGGLQAGIARLSADRVDGAAAKDALQRLHGLKGLCGLAGFKRAETLIHAGESLAAALAQAPASPLALSRLSRMIERLGELFASAAEHRHEPAGDDADLVAAIEDAATKLREAPRPATIALSGAEPVPPPVVMDALQAASGPQGERRAPAPWMGLDTLARTLGDQLGKRIELMVGGDDLRIAPAASRPLRLALIALVRNACDHGVETVAERRAAAKPALSLLRLSVHRRADGAILEFTDDGRGIDCEALRALQAMAGAPVSSEPLDPEALQDLVFASGLSTAQAAGAISGRGVGLALVRAELQAVGGSVRFSSRPGKGACFTMTLPISAVATPAARSRAAA